MDEVIDAFQRALEAHGGRVVTVDDDDSVRFEFQGANGSAYLDNVRRRVSMGDKLEDAVGDLIDLIVTPWKIPDDPDGRNAGLRLALEQTAVLSSFDAIHKRVSRDVVLALVWTDGLGIRYLTPESIGSWGLTAEAAWAEAGRQMDALLSQTEVEVSPVASSHMAFFVTDSPFKASLIAAPSLRKRIEPQLGWPILALAPCRDYVLLFPHAAKELIPRLGKRIRREYETAAYPLSPEVFSISDDGIKAMGRFSEQES